MQYHHHENKGNDYFGGERAWTTPRAGHGYDVIDRCMRRPRMEQKRYADGAGCAAEELPRDVEDGLPCGNLAEKGNLVDGLMCAPDCWPHGE